MFSRDICVVPDCPECGKKDGAIKGSSMWGHDISCCSDECGEAIAAKLESNRKSKEYTDACQAYHKAKDRLMKAKYKDVNAIGFSDRMPNSFPF